jgi:hypothetical protein
MLLSKFLFIFLLIIIGCGNGTNSSPGEFTALADVNKTWVDDDQMCWAAVTANILAGDEDEIFNELKSAFPNQPNTVGNGLAYFGESFQTAFDSVIDFILIEIDRFGVVAINIATPQGRHYLTVYDYQKNPEIILYVVDSNDRINRIFPLAVNDRTVNYRGDFCRIEYATVLADG